MHGGGLFMMLRQHVAYAKPWQQVLGSAACVAIGIVVVASGHVTGLLVSLFGVGLAAQALGLRRHGRRSHPVETGAKSPVRHREGAD
jgi:hypothetical protein